MLSAVARIPPSNRSLPPIPDGDISTPSMIRRPRVPRMGTCVPLRPPTTSAIPNSALSCQKQSTNNDKSRNSCDLVVQKKCDNEGTELRSSSAPSEHSYAEYLTTPLLPMTERRSPSPKSSRRRVSRLSGEVIGHCSRRSRSSNTITTTSKTVTSANPTVISGMYRLKVKRSSESQFQTEFMGNKNLIRKYRQRRAGQKRHRSKEEAEEEDEEEGEMPKVGGCEDPEYDTVDATNDTGRGENSPLLSKPVASMFPASSLPTHHVARGQRRSNKHHHRHHHHHPPPQSSYDSPCRLVTMLVI